MEGRSGDRQARDRQRLASHGIPSLLALALPTAERSAQIARGDQDAHPPYGRRKRGLGRTKDPRRTAQAWVRRLGTDRRKVPAELRRKGDPAKRWLAFLNNHREAIVAFDFFTVPTITFRLLYCFFVIEHGRRRILHFNVTSRPTSEWVVQQLREAFPDSGPYRYVILDRDSKFDADVIAFLKSSG